MSKPKRVMLSSTLFVSGLCVDLCQSLRLIAPEGGGLELHRLIRRMSFESSAGLRGRQAWPCVFCRGCVPLVLPDAWDVVGGGERWLWQARACLRGADGHFCIESFCLDPK